MSATRIPAPPLLPGYAPPAGFAFRRLGWMVRSLAVTGTRAPCRYRLLPWGVLAEFLIVIALTAGVLSVLYDAPVLCHLGAACVIVTVFFAALLLLANAVAAMKPGRRVYVSRDRDAMLRVTAKQKGERGWHIDDHARAARRKGAGARMRAELAATLLGTADENNIDVWAVAVTEKLAVAYMSDLPGLTIIGRTKRGGYRLHRPARYYLRYAPAPRNDVTPEEAFGQSWDAHIGDLDGRFDVHNPERTATAGEGSAIRNETNL